MVGFEMTARSNHGFYWHSGAWTEGSLLFLQLAIQARKLPIPSWAAPAVNASVGRAGAKEVGAVKDLFSQFKGIMLYDAANLGLNFDLVVWGGPRTYLRHSFQAGAPADQAALGLLWKVEKAEFGDQVVIHLCRCLQDFRLEAIGKNQNDLGLYVKLEL